MSFSRRIFHLLRELLQFKQTGGWLKRTNNPARQLAQAGGLAARRFGQRFGHPTNTSKAQTQFKGDMMDNESKRILLVEDEKTIREAVTAYLEREAYSVVAVEDGREALNAFEEHHFDLLILDLMLPRVSGEEVCKTVRTTSNVPIIMLTAKGEVEDRIVGFNLGADDYLIKPFSPRELVARTRALLRRAGDAQDSPRDVNDYGGLVIDVTGHKVTVDGKEVDLTASEFKLLSTLARFPGRVYSRMELVEKVLGYDFEGYERTIDSHVKNLRAKIGDNPRDPKWLHTVHGVGYRFEDPTKK